MTIAGIEYVDLLAMAVADGAHLKRISPTEYAGPCPKCGGQVGIDDRFHVLTRTRQGKHGWFCRKCPDAPKPDKMGDAADYVRIMRGLSGREAFDLLRHFGLPADGRSRGRIGQVEALSRPVVVRSAAGLTLQADGALPEPPAEAWQAEVDVLLWGRPSGAYWRLRDFDAEAIAAQAYLEQQRHLTPETIQRFALGYLPASITTGPMGWRAATSGAIVMPWVFGSCQYWKVQYRAVGSGVPKEHRYRQKKGADVTGGLPPFNADAIKTAGVVLVVEGEFDAMLAQQVAPVGVAVVTWGSASIAPNGWAESLLKNRRVLLVFDADSAGQQAAARWEVLGKRITLPAGKDIGDFADLHGVDALRQWIAEVTK